MRASRIDACVLALALCSCGSGDEAAQPEPVAATPSRLEALGKELFFDFQLSNPRGQSCASCHDPETGFSGNFGSSSGVPRGADGESLGLRNTPTAAYAAFAPVLTVEMTASGPRARGGQFLDGRAASLEEQAAMPFFAAGEMNIASPTELAARIASRPYAALLREEFGATVFADPDQLVRSVARAIAAFERTTQLAPFSSRLDRSLAGGPALSPIEAEGMRLFLDPLKGDCASCHAFDPASAAREARLFTNFSYHVLGAPRNLRIPENADPAFFDLGLCGPKRQVATDGRLCGAFKVPTLRNVARKPAFMHNGVFRSLRDAVAFHATRDSSPARWYSSGVAYDDLPVAHRANVDRSSMATFGRLDEREIDAITAFLGALDDDVSTLRGDRLQ